jgi:hypothetical protein
VRERKAVEGRNDGDGERRAATSLLCFASTTSRVSRLISSERSFVCSVVCSLIGIRGSKSFNHCTFRFGHQTSLPLLVAQRLMSVRQHLQIELCLF